jgi:hypothetical protein
MIGTCATLFEHVSRLRHLSSLERLTLDKDIVTQLFGTKSWSGTPLIVVPAG